MSNTQIDDILSKIQGQSLDDLKKEILVAGPCIISKGARKDIKDHFASLASEFSGQPLLSFHHACLIVRIRRRQDLERTLAEFFSVWDAQHQFLLDRLSARWLVSACDTFADYGRTPADKLAGAAGALLLNTVKLYETERRAIGALDLAYGKLALLQPIFDGIQTYNIGWGDMIRNLLSRLDRTIPNDSPAGMILREIVARTLAGDTVFRRFALCHENDNTRWGYFPKKVALFNYTTRGGHFGRAAVLDVIDHLIANAGSTVFFRHKAEVDWRSDPEARSAIEAADAVVVIGESWTHSSPRALMLSEIAREAAKVGKRSFLVNSTLQALDDKTIENIRNFSHTWVRESASSQLLLEAGIAHSICPDLTFLTRIPQANLTVGTTLFVDSVRKDANRLLAGMAASRETDLVVMKRHPTEPACLGIPFSQLEQEIDTPIKTKTRPCEDYRDFARIISAHHQLVTGRFHAACFAILLGVPFAAFPSNTYQTEALIRDIGLDKNRLLGPQSVSAEVNVYSEGEIEAISTYIARAQTAADRMIERICS